MLYEAASGAGRIGPSPKSADLAAGLSGLVDRSRLRGFDKKKRDSLDKQNSELHLKGARARRQTFLLVGFDSRGLDVSGIYIFQNWGYKEFQLISC